MFGGLSALAHQAALEAEPPSFLEMLGDVIEDVSGFVEDVAAPVVAFGQQLFGGGQPPPVTSAPTGGEQPTLEQLGHPDAMPWWRRNAHWLLAGGAVVVGYLVLR